MTETSTGFYNERQKVEIDLYKVMEQNSVFGIGNNGEITSVNFGLFAAEEIVAADGSSIPAGWVLEVVECNENGYAAFSTDLPVGSKTYVKEISTDSHYVLSDEEYPVVFEYAGQEVATVHITVNDGKDITNELIYGTIKGYKVNRETGDKISGALFGLFRADETSFTKDNAFLTAESGEDGVFDMESFKSCMSKDVKVVSVQHTSNVTGSSVPVKAVTEIAHDYGATVIIDGAQATPHMPVDLKKIDADIYCLSMHKMLGPSGMGVMYGKKEVLEKLRPLTLGGGTVGLATYDSVSLAPVPDRFEAGLLNYAGIIGTKAAIDYLSKVGMDNVEKQDTDLLKRAFSNLEDVKGLHIVGPDQPGKRCGILSFNIDGLVSHDIAMMLDSMSGVMIRSGMHCAHPFYVSKAIDGSARASTYLYNSPEEIDIFTDTVRKIAETFGERSRPFPHTPS